jgi:hypothetical protein
VPRDESIDERSIAYEASRDRVRRDGAKEPAFPVRGTFRVNAITIPTPRSHRGPRREFMVAVVLRPLGTGKKAEPVPSQSALF